MKMAEASAIFRKKSNKFSRKFDAFGEDLEETKEAIGRVPLATVGVFG